MCKYGDATCFLPPTQVHIHDVPMFSISDWFFELEITVSVMHIQFSFQKLLLERKNPYSMVLTLNSDLLFTLLFRGKKSVTHRNSQGI